MRSKATTGWQSNKEIEAQVVVLGLLARSVSGQQQPCDKQATNNLHVSDTKFDDLCFDQSSQSSTSSQYLLKKNLLLCLAQLFACFDIPHFVSCAALGNKHRAGTVFITRNNGFQERDFVFRTALCESVTAISQRKPDIPKSPMEMNWLK
jgi:hypothetical protein